MSSSEIEEGISADFYFATFALIFRMLDFLLWIWGIDNKLSPNSYGMISWVLMRDQGIFPKIVQSFIHISFLFKGFLFKGVCIVKY